jgi:hypothetical protein
MVFKLVEGAWKNWLRLDGHALLPELILGVKFTNGLEVIAKASDLQAATAAARKIRPSPTSGDRSVGKREASADLRDRPVARSIFREGGLPPRRIHTD